MPYPNGSLSTGFYIIFKKVFCFQQNRDVLISFLDALLFESQKKIEDLEIIDSKQAPMIKGIEDSFLCVEAAIAGHKTIIEMQVVNLWGHERLSFYETAAAGIIQLNRSPKHAKFKSVIVLTIADVEIFHDTSEVISWYSLAENEELTGCSEDTDLVFIELTKFTKSLEQIITLADRWIYFMKRARNLKAIPEDWQDNPVFNKAFRAAEVSNLNREELDLIYS